jgi:hypothetical protein
MLVSATVVLTRLPPRYQPAFARRLDQALMDRFDAIWTNHEGLITVLASGNRSK